MASLTGVQPQTLAVPPPPQETPVPVQVPQASVRGLPQRSVVANVPQFLLERAQRTASVSGVQPQRLATPGLPPPQLWFDTEQVPHEATVLGLPQVSAPTTWPQFFPNRAQKAASVSAVTVQPPQTLGTPGEPPPQVWLKFWQVPQAGCGSGRSCRSR